ncbi:MAG TPA: diacylglycerol kinase family protein [Tissierellaceae bacterium]|nr:diacylglycerol kinase family protein [Tissierellaceae bacterium]
MDKLLFIINPTAGGGRAKDLKALIEKSMEEHKLSYDIILTTRSKEAIEIVQNSPHYKVIAVGGDGTVNEVAKGLINRKFGVLGILPGGTGNDLSRSLNIPLDPLDAIDCIVNGKMRNVDIGIINGYPFLNIASFGFDAEVVHITKKIKTRIKSNIAYILGVLITLIRFRKKEVVLEINGKRYKEKVVLLAAGNGKFYGGGLKVLPNARLLDDYLDLCLVKNVNKLFILFLFPTIFKGNHIKYRKYVSTYKAKNIRIISEEDIYFNLDGEILSGGKILDFTMAGYKLPIIYRKNKNSNISLN